MGKRSDWLVPGTDSQTWILICMDGTKYNNSIVIIYTKVSGGPPLENISN